jgi:hypothetical protein
MKKKKKFGHPKVTVERSRSGSVNSGTDLRIRIQIRTKMSRISNTAGKVTGRYITVRTGMSERMYRRYLTKCL